MSKCLNCETETVNDKFCSRSCSASYNNLQKIKKSYGVCEECSKDLIRKQTKFCSLECMGKSRTREKLSLWLSTGNGNVAGWVNPIRSYLYEEQQFLCALCPQTIMWRGQELKFILDHINGDSLNNKRENLRLICPNCDSQLPTYKSKNIGKGRHWRRMRYTEGKSY